MIEIKRDDTFFFKVLNNNDKFYYLNHLGIFYAKLSRDTCVCLDSDSTNEILKFIPSEVKYIVKIKSIDIDFEKETCLNHKISYRRDDIYNDLKSTELYITKKSNHISSNKLINGFFATKIGENSYRLRYKIDDEYYHFGEKFLKTSETEYELNIQPINVQITLTKDQ